MAALLPGDHSHHAVVENGLCSYSHDKHEELDRTGSSWYLSGKDIEENSPSRKDGIDVKKEASFQKLYCTFLQELGMSLKVPQITIATAMIFCHRFFLRQSHAKNDRRDVFEKQKELILLGERVVLATLNFDLNVDHPYKPLVEAIKKFKVAPGPLAQVAWNFVNDGLRTSLCLQFKPHHIAAGAIFLAARFLKVKLPSDGNTVWWREFHVTPKKLEEVGNQMLELYEQNQAASASKGNEAEGGGAAGSPHRVSSVEKSMAVNICIQGSGLTSAKYGPSPAVAPPPLLSLSVVEQSRPEKQNKIQRISHNKTPNHFDQRTDARNKEEQYHDMEALHRPHIIPDQAQDDLSHADMRKATKEKELKDDGLSFKSGPTADVRSSIHLDDPNGYSPIDAIKKINKDKVKAALEKHRKSRADVVRKVDAMDFDDIIEREIESGVEVAVEGQKVNQERRQGLSSSMPQKSPCSESGDNNTRKRKLPSFETPVECDSRMRKEASPEYSKQKRREHMHEFSHRMA